MANMIPPDTWLSLEAAPDDDSKASIAYAILEGVLRSTIAVSEVAKQMSSESASIRFWAAWILEESGHRVQQVPQHVLAGMEDPNPSVRALCSECAYWLEDEWLLPAMCDLLAHLDDEFLVSSHAARVLFLKMEKQRRAKRWQLFLSELENCAKSDSRLAGDRTHICDALNHSRNCKQSRRGVQSPFQRVALLWVVGAAVADPPAVCALFDALKSRHVTASVFAAERLTSIISSANISHGSIHERDRPNPRAIAMRALGEAFIASDRLSDGSIE